MIIYMKKLLFLSFIIILTGAGCFPINDVVIKKTIPEIVEVNTDFDFTVTVTNNEDRLKTLYSLDLGKNFYEGLNIISTTPPMTGQEHLLFNMQSYILEIEIPAHESRDITFHAKAKKLDYGVVI